MTGRIKITPRVCTTITLEALLATHNIGLEVIEGASGCWYARLVGAAAPASRYRAGATNSVSPTISPWRGCVTPQRAVEAACEYLTRSPRILRTDGTEINLRNIEVTPS